MKLIQKYPSFRGIDDHVLLFSQNPGKSLMWYTKHLLCQLALVGVSLMRLVKNFNFPSNIML